MHRNAAIAVSLLTVVGCLVTLVGAQESGARMNARGYGNQPGLLPAHLPARPVAEGSQPGGSLSAALQAATADITDEYAADSAAQVGHTSTIKPTQFKSTRPKPTYPNRSTPQRRPAQPAPQFQQPGSVYAPVPTSPPTIEQPPAQVAERFSTRGAPQTVAQQPATEATLGAPVEAELTPAAETAGDSAEPTTTPTVGMRSVLKRSGDAPEITPDLPMSTAGENDGAPAFDQEDSAADEDQPTGISARRTNGGLAVPSSTIPSPDAADTADSRSIQDLSLTGRSPGLRVAVAGPQSITVGKSVTYVVNLFNDGNVDAQGVQVKATIPSWVSISSGETTDGEAAVQSDGRGSATLLWKVTKVPAKSHQTLRLVLAASQGRPFDLGLEWAMQPATAAATIAVQQPQLELSLAGPADMIFGQQKVFTLTVSNPGSGDAERVAVSIASGDNRPQQIDVGSIPAGMQKEIPVQVAANHAGEMSMKAIAAAEGGLRAEALGKVMVRRAMVMVAVEGPQLKYAGTDATYEVVLSNTGDAPADDMLASLALPAGAKYLGGVEGASTTPAAIKWKVSGIPAGSQRAYQLKLQLNTMGLSRVVVQAHNEAGVAVSGMAETKVEAIADLKLTVNDPAGPIAVGTDAVYELTLVNRGTKSAAGVRVVMQFGEGVEPLSVEGADARLVPGQVVCEPLAQLAAGEKVTLRVKAAANSEGTHPFRVEVTASDNETRLVSEGTSRFFADSELDAASRTARQPLVPQPTMPGVLQR